ncbi:helix-turn-helix domain-containing protein [Rhodopirellula bahusiensis]|uniref:helix-turn-helix domain-containing protein n=1 Tax=Rhodopirellula bahusiensis TaxID=2014065 RepID=UPI003267358F
MSVPKVAAELGCGIDQVRNLIAAGELPAVNIGLGKQRARWSVSREDLDAFKARRASKSPQVKHRRTDVPTPRRQWV